LIEHIRIHGGFQGVAYFPGASLCLASSEVNSKHQAVTKSGAASGCIPTPKTQW
jgi:hypothetical protein